MVTDSFDKSREDLEIWPREGTESGKNGASQEEDVPCVGAL